MIFFFFSLLSLSANHQNPEPGSSQILSQHGPPKSLIKTRSRIQGSWSLWRRKGQLPDECAQMHIFRNGLCGLHTLCQSCCSLPFCVRGWPQPCVSAARDPMCRSFCRKIIQKHKAHPKLHYYYFSMFSYKSQVAPCTDYAFFRGRGIEIFCACKIWDNYLFILKF